jgi:hypothetical protein
VWGTHDAVWWEVTLSAVGSRNPEDWSSAFAVYTELCTMIQMFCKQLNLNQNAVPIRGFKYMNDNSSAQDLPTPFSQSKVLHFPSKISLLHVYETLV